MAEGVPSPHNIYKTAPGKPEKERFIAQKACYRAEMLTPQTPFGMTVCEYSASCGAVPS
jgi:hypothetical protein